MRVLACACACLATLAACRSAADGERRLSIDPERRGFEIPPRPAIVFYVDGLRADLFESLAREGALPHLRRLLLDRGASVRAAVASVPSVTYANALTMLTGTWPSTHGVWSNACFDRDRLMLRDYEANSEHAHEDGAAPTLFELLGSEITAAVALSTDRGAKLRAAASAATGGWGAWIAWALGREQDADAALAGELYAIGEQARAIGEWPALVVVHLPGVDDVGHEHGSDAREYREAVASLDDAIGTVLETFERGGMLDAITVVLTSDHGHHPVPRSAALDEHLRAVIGEPVLHAAEDDSDAPFLERWERYSAVRVVLTTSGERQASIHLRAGERWTERPSLAQILAFPAAPRASHGPDLPERVLQLPAVELVAVRAGVDEVRVHGKTGIALIERDRSAGEPRFGYRVLAGDDPLDYHADAALARWIAGGAHDSRTWLEATARTPAPDLVPQLAAAFDHERSGDLIVFAAPGWDFSDEYAGGHGGVERDEMIVPLVIAGPGIRPGIEIDAARLVDLVPTLVDLLEIEVPANVRFDGVSLAPALR